MYRTFLSLRYLATRRINLIGVGGLFLSVGAMVLILAIMTGFLDLSRTMLRGTLSDILVTPQHLPRYDGRVAPLEPEPLLEVILADGRVTGASPRLMWYALASTDADEDVQRLASGSKLQESVFHLVGLDPQLEFGVSDLRQRLAAEPGEYGVPVADPERPFAPPAGTPPELAQLTPVVVGEQLFGRMGLEVGRPLRLVTWIPDPEHDAVRTEAREFLVAGTFRSGDNELDLSRIYMERAALRAFIGEVRGFSEIGVRLADYEEQALEVRADLFTALDSHGLIRGREAYEVRTWEQFRGALIGSIENQRVIMMLLLSLVLVVAGFTVFAILSMMVKEKTRDIGVLAALGANPAGIRWLFVMVGLWEVLVGGGLGALGGTWAARNIDAIERWLSQALGLQIFNREVYLFDSIPTRIEPEAVLTILACSFAAVFLFTLGPAWSASRVDPIRSLRYE